MNIKKISLLLLLFTFLFSQNVIAHSGRTDSSGGHNCSAKSISKGLCTGYHYHNGGSKSNNSDSAPSNSNSTPTPATTPKSSIDHQDSSVKVYVNETELTFDHPPIIVSGFNLVPLRKIIESLGATVDWEQSTQTITIKKDTTETVLQINSKIIKINGKEISQDIAPIVLEGITFVPIRVVAESLGATVNYDSATNSIKITY